MSISTKQLFNKKDLENLGVGAFKRTNIINILRQHCDSIEKMTTIENKKGIKICTPMFYFDIEEAVAFMKDYAVKDNRGFIKKSRNETLGYLLQLQEKMILSHCADVA